MNSRPRHPNHRKEKTMNERNLNEVPKAACMFAGGVVELGDNGKDAKSAPIRLKARSGDPIEHWYWGKVVHDLAGMRTHKARLTVDYAHNDSEVLGYLNHFDISSGDLVASGALTPWREDDRASEVMFKMRQGVPYEASIFFGGNGVKIEEVGEGVDLQVNGRKFSGPGIVIREWPLRGVAICPYGADQNTESRMFDAGETVSVEKVQPKEIKMEANEPAVEAEALTEGKPPVEVAAVEAEAKPEADKPDQQLSEKAESVAGMVTQLTAERDALKSSVEAIKVERDAVVKERDELKAKHDKAEAELSALKAERDDAVKKLAAIEAGAPPVSATPAPEVQAESAWKKAQKSSPSKRA